MIAATAEPNGVAFPATASYPLEAKFKDYLASSELRITDSGGRLLLYTKTSIPADVEVRLFADEGQTQRIGSLRRPSGLGSVTDRYDFVLPGGPDAGGIRTVRPAWWSRPHFVVFDSDDNPVSTVEYARPWLGTLDNILSMSLVAGVLGLFPLVSPDYVLAGPDGARHMRLKGRVSMLASHFTITRLGELGPLDEQRVLFALVAVMLQRRWPS